MAKVSIIIPIYNVENYLEECLDTVVRQTLKDIEIICVNDGSTDSSLDIIQRFAKEDNRIKVITGPNQGYGKAMNQGLDAATGEYIGIVEPDDYVALDMFEQLYKVAAKDSLDIVKADFYQFKRDYSGSVNAIYMHLSDLKRDYNRILHPVEDQECFRFIINTWSGIYKRDLIERRHIRHNETPGASFQDTGFWFQTIAFADTMMIIDKPLYRYRFDNPNSSSINPSKVYAVNGEYQFIRDIVSKDKDLWEKLKYVYTMRKFTGYIFTADRIAMESKLEYLENFRKEFLKAKEDGELSRGPFLPEEWEHLTAILESPKAYYHKHYCLDKTQQELDRIKNSYSYKLGMAMTYIPRKTKKLLRKLRRRL